MVLVRSVFRSLNEKLRKFELKIESKFGHYTVVTILLTSVLKTQALAGGSKDIKDGFSAYS